MSRSLLARACRRMWLPLAVAALGGCGSSIQYYHVSITPVTPAAGTNCGLTDEETVTYSNVAESEEWAIYPAASSTYLLEGAASGALVSGAQSGSSYSFTGTDTVVEKAGTGTNATQVTLEAKTSASVKTTSPGLTGTLTLEISCHSSDGTSCPPFQGQGSTSNKDFDCTASETVSGTLLSNVQPETFTTSADSGSLAPYVSDYENSNTCTTSTCAEPANCEDNCGSYDPSVCAGAECDSNNPGYDTCNEPDSNCSSCTPSSCQDPAACEDNCENYNPSVCAGAECDSNNPGYDTCDEPDSNCP